MPGISVQKGSLLCTLAQAPAPEVLERLDRFFNDSPAAAYMQTTIWPEIAPITRLQHLRHLWCEQNGRLLLAGVVRFSRLFPGYTLAWLARGPVVHDIPDLDTCLPAMMETLYQAGASTVLINPHWQDENAEVVCNILAGHRLRMVNKGNQPSYTVTGYVDLTRPEDGIFADFKSRCRRHIRRALRHGLTIRQAVDERDVARFEVLFKDFAKRKKLDIAGQPDMLDQWRYVQTTGGVFLLAELDGRLVGGHVAFREGRRAVWITMAYEEASSDVPRSYNLLWEAMRCMKHAGCHDFDLAGLSQDGTEDIGQKNRDFFKMSFNPRRVQLVPTYVAALRPLRHAIFFEARQAYRRSPLRRYITPLLKR